jgi:hypothetical protein
VTGLIEFFFFGILFYMQSVLVRSGNCVDTCVQVYMYTEACTGVLSSAPP